MLTGSSGAVEGEPAAIEGRAALQARFACPSNSGHGENVSTGPSAAFPLARKRRRRHPSRASPEDQGRAPRAPCRRPNLQRPARSEAGCSAGGPVGRVVSLVRSCVPVTGRQTAQPDSRSSTGCGRQAPASRRRSQWTTSKRLLTQDAALSLRLAEAGVSPPLGRHGRSSSAAGAPERYSGAPIWAKAGAGSATPPPRRFPVNAGRTGSLLLARSRRGWRGRRESCFHGNEQFGRGLE
jgi:hypothetical protein